MASMFTPSKNSVFRSLFNPLAYTYFKFPFRLIYLVPRNMPFFFLSLGSGGVYRYRLWCLCNVHVPNI